MENNYDPSNYKWGIFYYNKADKRIFPPKSLGIGWTVNFANPVSVVAMIVIIILVVAFTPALRSVPQENYGGK